MKTACVYHSVDLDGWMHEWYNRIGFKDYFKSASIYGDEFTITVYTEEQFNKLISK